VVKLRARMDKEIKIKARCDIRTVLKGQFGPEFVPYTPPGPPEE